MLLEIQYLDLQNLKAKSYEELRDGTAPEERGVLGILNETENFHHYCFMREVSVIRPQTTSCNIQKGCDNTVTMVLMHKTPHSSKNLIYILQTRS